MKIIFYDKYIKYNIQEYTFFFKKVIKFTFNSWDWNSLRNIFVKSKLKFILLS